MKSISEHMSPAEETESWLEMLPVNDPVLQFAKISLRTARLCYSSQVLFDSSSNDEWWVIQMLQIIKEPILLDLEYQEWSEILPST